MNITSGKVTKIAVVTVVLVFLVFVTCYFIDLSKEYRLFKAPPGHGYAAILVDIRNGSKDESDAIIEKMMGIEGQLTERPSIAYSIGAHRTRVRVNRRIDDLTATQFSNFESWFKRRNFTGEWSVIFYDGDQVFRQIRSGYNVEPAGSRQ